MPPNLESEGKMNMRSSTRPSFFALVIGLWIPLCAIVLVSVLVAPPAGGQTLEGNECLDRRKPGCNSWWSPEEDDKRYPRGYGALRVLESAGEVVMKFTTEEPGRTEYSTKDGDCSGYPTAEDPANETPVSTDECGRPYARAGEDYGAVRGKWTFTEAGSRTIRIPIIDDDLDEIDGEAFTIEAGHWGDMWPAPGVSNAFIYIVDDDPKQTPGSSTSAGGPNRQIAGPQTGSPTRPAPPPVRSSSSEPTDFGNQSGAGNPGDPNLEVEKSAGDQAEMIAADTEREDNFIPMASLRALLFVMIAAASFALRKKFVRKKT